jgi:membrane AbrB-like protein
MVTLTLIAGLAGGYAFEALRAPLPYLLGSLTACGLLSINNLCAPLPKPGLRAGQISIGLALGLYFTASVVDALGGIMGWVLLSAALSTLLGLAGALFLQRRTGLDAQTSYFAAVIGAASDMANQAALAGGRGDLVAIAHTIRVSIVVGTAPFLASYFASSSPSVTWTATEDQILSWPITAGLLMASMGSAWLTQRLRFPSPWVLGPIVAGGIFASFVQEGRLDTIILIGGQVFIGWNLGQRFSTKAIREAPVLSVNVFFLTLAYSVLGLGMAGLAQGGAGLDWASGFVATTPGGIAEMALTAKVLGLDSPAVTAFHVVRLIVVVVSSHYLISLCLKKGWLVDNPKETRKNGEQPSA